MGASATCVDIFQGEECMPGCAAARVTASCTPRRATPRHATTSRILPSRYCFQIDVRATRNNAVRSRRTALRLCTAEGCVHPSSSTPSVVNNTDFAARPPAPPLFPSAVKNARAPVSLSSDPGLFQAVPRPPCKSAVPVQLTFRSG